MGTCGMSNRTHNLVWECILKWGKLGMDFLRAILFKGGNIYLDLLRYGDTLMF
jgi:hypothetical protein